MFTGCMVALITPMDMKGNICKSNLKKLIQYHINNKTKAIVILGTTGESATVNYNEHINTIMWSLDIAQDKIPIIAGTGFNSTSKSIKMISILEKTNIIGCLNVTPYYNRPTQNGLYQHFKAIAESTNIPQILYNVPKRTGCDLLPETIYRLSKIKNIIGIKEATGDLSRVNKIKNLVHENFFLISGDDSTAFEFILLGGHGVISVTANIAAKYMNKFVNYALKNKIKKANNLNQSLMLLHQQLFIESNPIPVKWAAKYIGLINSDFIRLPLTKLTDTNKKLIKKTLNMLQLI
ncbi:4-hydroxy-tetrahydrodipicolinate synthase [Enterobacteriaceae endosymbiont of Neohaemonia nigricornis]|uniref:4-hydroxy-tetrahydrodipicolinate synthase n=1 Tax=Enterobacteriaceae endosymbiont of Neohaemonia nigricornis TaxID=2675792 RepID=UPI001449EB59|nr:4-hydroxy-tetrahydrodipicolinate synthase [Enterobacteriaceae endosymbiont of Neohaemonia nigricornis]QJC30257.1 4-hydroxy-tetrahydrodipicolinate synthase [Enterobacteriaceae endosymbiont of Neohaemonia nigricornis]